MAYNETVLSLKNIPRPKQSDNPKFVFAALPFGNHYNTACTNILFIINTSQLCSFQQ